MINNVYKIIDLIESSNIKKKLDVIKLQIKNDKDATDLINKFNSAKQLYEKYNYKDEFIKAKMNLYNNKLIKEYIDIQNDFNYLMLYINSKFKDIIN